MDLTSELRGISVLTGRAVEIEIGGDRITHVTEVDSRPDDRFLAPGFLDIQVNGFKGIDYSSPDLSADGVVSVIASLEPSGTTCHLPTIITSPQSRIVSNVKTIVRAVEERDLYTAIAGIHVEGPYISEVDGPRGAHDAQFVRDPSIAEYEDWQAVANGLLRIITIAPERPGSLQFIERLVADGVIVALGHTQASPEIIRDAVSAGARMSTHLGNGSPLMVHRFKNHLWSQIANDDLTAGIIADGFHLPVDFMRVVTRTKSIDRIILVSDVGAIAGREPGVYPWGTTKVRVYPDGHLQVDGTEFLAGAGHLLDRCVHHFVSTGIGTLSEAVAGCTRNPARLLSLSEPRADIRVGAPADIVEFRYVAEDASLEIERVFRDGTLVFPRTETTDL